MLYEYLPDNLSFRSSQAARIRRLYMPLTGIKDNAIISTITPYLSGDIKVNKFQYITKPASREDLLSNVRNVFIRIEGQGYYSLADEQGASDSFIEAGPLWHRLTREYTQAGFRVEVLNFVPVTGENVELMRVFITNISNKPLKFEPIVAIPMFARALANKHDHEHVTSLLHRIEQRPEGVLVEPTMLFDEEGHKANDNVYFVFGSDEHGKRPAGTYPTVQDFLGEGGTLSQPEAVTQNKKPRSLPRESLEGKEAMGALRFEEAKLVPEGSCEYYIMTGVAGSKEKAESLYTQFNTSDAVEAAFDKNRHFWREKAGAIVYRTADPDFNSWMQWVNLQPVLRRICGCSFLPDHDYGKGGRGWRDLWQDLLSLILIEPETVRDSLFDNFGGVRIDGSNATIIGSGEKPFIADRNAITRVWMDHGAWPFLTLLLYMDQTGDLDILLQGQTYFRDPQQSRAFRKDEQWTAQYGNVLKTTQGKVYQGTVLEHILIQHLTQFFNVGEHNIIRLEGADWNDGLDMARERGESVAFTAFYGGNLLSLADLIEKLPDDEIEVAKELRILLDTLNPLSINYNSAEAKRDLLFDSYFLAVQPELSGEKIKLKARDVARDLRKKGKWIFDHINRQERVTAGGNTWINGYYDEKGERVEGEKDGRVWMTLTGQVFPVMSGLLKPADIKEVVKSVEAHLKDKKLGGYRLNTDFGLRRYLDLGRAFGFAYGTKENGAFFSHMVVMYAYGLYKQGLAREGFEVLDSVYRMSIDTEQSKIYPGVPEYFDSEGRGMYPYLTGSASWYVLTMLTQAFGVRGMDGDLVLSPKLVKEQFDEQGDASITATFAGKKITVTYVNPKKLDAGEYAVKDIILHKLPISFQSLSASEARIMRMIIEDAADDVQLRVMLDELK